MSLLTLTTDYGYKDAEVALLKAFILRLDSSIPCIDVTHDITPYAIIEAAYVMQSIVPAFPEGTVHFMGMEPNATTNRDLVAVLWNKHFWVGSDNGVFSLLMTDSAPEKIVKLNNLSTGKNDVETLLHAAVHLAQGKSIDDLGMPLDQLKKAHALKPVHDAEQKFIKIRVLFRDHFGNVITNLTKSQFEEWIGSKPFEIKLGKISIRKIIDSYEDVVPLNNSFEIHFYEGKEFARFNKNGHLEIGLFRSITNKTGAASSLLGIDFMTEIRIYYN